MGGRWIVDASNVMGARPDGWWRDRPAALRRLVDEVVRWRASAGEPVVVVVADGFPSAEVGEGDREGVEVRFAHSTDRDAADDVIVALVEGDPDPASVQVATSDRRLRERVMALGAGVEGARRFLDRLAGDPPTVRPLLLVVAGPPACGKTTLSRALADRLGLPVVCRDAIKEGASYTTGRVIEHGTPEASRMFDLFYEIVDAHLARGVSVIAEAAFRADLAPDELLGRRDRARLRLIRCGAPADVWFGRFQDRGERPGHLDGAFVARTAAAGGPDSSIYAVDLPGIPTLDVDTTDGYQPSLDEIVAFAAGA